MEHWPAVRCPRFDGESEASYRRRSAEVTEIIEAFRRGRYSRSEGERMEQRLLELQRPELEDA